MIARCDAICLRVGSEESPSGGMSVARNPARSEEGRVGRRLEGTEAKRADYSVFSQSEQTSTDHKGTHSYSYV